MDSISYHPFNNDKYIPSNATKLILGSIPPQHICFQNLKEGDVNFYYGSKKNQFWPLIASVTKVSLSYNNTSASKLERINLLAKYHLGIYDLIHSCIHVNTSSLDRDLKILQYEDIPSLLQEFPKLDTIICTSNFVRQKLNLQAHQKYQPNKNNPKEGTMGFNHKNYHIITLYSPSPCALRRLGNKGKELRLKQYLEVFGLN